MRTVEKVADGCACNLLFLFAAVVVAIENPKTASGFTLVQITATLLHLGTRESASAEPFGLYVSVLGGEHARRAV